MKFKLLRGTHREGNKIYTAGQVVETDKNLEKKFVNKFKRVMKYTLENPPTKEDIEKPVEKVEEESKVEEEVKDEVVEEEKEEEQAETEHEKPTIPHFVPKHKGAGKYYIINENADNKPLNDRLYDKEEALKVIEELHKDG